MPVVGQPIHFCAWVQTEKAEEKLTIDFGDGTVQKGYTCLSEWKEQKWWLTIAEHAYDTSGIHVLTIQTVFDGMPVMEKTKVLVDNK